MIVHKMEIKQLEKRKTGRETKREGLKDSDRKEKETKTGQRTYSLRQRLTETGSERAVLQQAPFKWMKSAPF